MPVESIRICIQETAERNKSDTLKEQ